MVLTQLGSYSKVAIFVVECRERPTRDLWGGGEKVELGSIYREERPRENWLSEEESASSFEFEGEWCLSEVGWEIADGVKIKIGLGEKIF